MIEIPLSNTTKVAIVDDKDSDLASLKWRWHNPHGVFLAHKPPTKLVRVIAERKLNRPLESYEKCRLFNGNKLDNRRDNVEIIPPPPIFNGEYFSISLSHDGKTALLDKIDIDLSLVKWSFLSNGYATRNTGSRRKGHKTKYLHRVILERILNRPLAKGEQGDHINGNRLDNRRANLRVSTHQQNAQHRTFKSPNTSSIYKGVLWARGKWKSQIKNNGILYHTGFFNEEIEAARAYDVAAAKHHKDFAAFNFPNEWQWDTSINQWIRT